jgi:hypothetical protein
VSLCTDASKDVREKNWMYLPLAYGTWVGISTGRICECVLLLQRADGKKPAGEYPYLFFSLTDVGPEPNPGVSSLCSRGRESANEQEPQTVLAGGRASTAARSPSLAASCSSPPSTRPAALGITERGRRPTNRDDRTAVALVQSPLAAPAAATSVVASSETRAHRSRKAMRAEMK